MSQRFIYILILGGCIILAGLFSINQGTLFVEAKMSGKPSNPEGKITVFNALTNQFEEVDFVNKTEEQWRSELSDQEYHVMREEGTERAGTGDLLKNKKTGVYTCASCGNHLFDSNTKFESGTGWPSYYQPINEKNVGTNTDSSFGMIRTEVHCARCGAHLGHIFPDGPKPTGQRYCINSVSLDFIEKEEE